MVYQERGRLFNFWQRKDRERVLRDLVSRAAEAGSADAHDMSFALELAIWQITDGPPQVPSSKRSVGVYLYDVLSRARRRLRKERVIDPGHPGNTRLRHDRSETHLILQEVYEMSRGEDYTGDVLRLMPIDKTILQHAEKLLFP